MVRKVRQEKRSHRVFKASQSSQGKSTPSPNAVADVDADSEEIAMKEWEQLWKRTMRKNENTLLRVRRKATPSSVAKQSFFP